MPTCPRKHQLVGSLVYHVYNRSNMRVPIFHTEKDCRCWIGSLKEYAAQFACTIYHWAVMVNHFHLLLELQDPRLVSSMMSGIQRAYTHYHHKNYDTSGYLWNGRFKLKAIQKDRYLISCGRYIERNPLRAGLVTRPEEYLYSSARYYCLGEVDGLTSRDPLYLNFGLSEDERRTTYRNFLHDFDEREDELFRDAAADSIGDSCFRARLIRVHGRCMPKEGGRPKGIVGKCHAT